ncbi:MAG: hypothetical protein RL368_1668 [Pseudomonadota bacterium]|jgi:hypothetical protein|nr:hypothetical protein [Thiotrichaceae bacterium]
MYAVEFETQLENGAIQVPEIYKTALTGLVKVIILKETPAPALWSPEIMAFQGIPDMPAFESYREELLPTQADPLA